MCSGVVTTTAISTWSGATSPSGSTASCITREPAFPFAGPASDQGFDVFSTPGDLSTGTGKNVGAILHVYLNSGRSYMFFAGQTLEDRDTGTFKQVGSLEVRLRLLRGYRSQQLTTWVPANPIERGAVEAPRLNSLDVPGPATMPGRVGSREWRAAVTAAMLVAGGLVMLRLGYGPFEFKAGVLALLTFWIVGGAGLITWLRAPASAGGPLLVAASVAWAIANLQRTPFALVNDLAAPLQLVYAAIIGHAVVAADEDPATQSRMAGDRWRLPWVTAPPATRRRGRVAGPAPRSWCRMR